MSARNRWVTFDCCGTLVDWHGWLGAALRPLAGDRAPDLHRGQDEVVCRAADLGRQTSSERGSEEVLAEPPEEDRHEHEGWSSMRLFSDVEAMLAELRLNGWQIGVLANCDDDLFEVTHRAFTRPFDVFVTSERVRAFKPERWHFRAFELITGVARHDWVHVGSSAYRDVGPARAFGLTPLWLDCRERGGSGRFSSVRVASRADVSRAIDALLERDEVRLPALQ